VILALKKDFWSFSIEEKRLIIHPLTLFINMLAYNFYQNISAKAGFYTLRSCMGILIWVLLAALPAHAQQEGMYTQFMFNKLNYNPGYAGSHASQTLTAIYRSQWRGIEGAPQAQVLSYSQPFLNERVGFGVNLSNQTIGINQMTNVDFMYAYQGIKLGYGKLGIGIQFSGRYFTQDWTDPRIVGTQPIGNDPSIPAQATNKLLFNFGAGIYYSSQKEWYVGVGCPRFLPNNIDFADDGGQLSREVFHLNLMGGKTFNLSDDLSLTPQVLARYAKNSPFDVDVNVSALVKRCVYGGLTYRTGGGITAKAGESIDLLLGVQATRKLFLCVSYDFSLTPLGRNTTGAIEASVRWWFNPKDPGTIIADPI
jgi:type IX secretion system PorP/SprF family membrane protein